MRRRAQRSRELGVPAAVWAQDRSPGSAGWESARPHQRVYLQAGRLIQTEAPALLARLVGAMREADARTPGWRRWGESFRLRVVEFHTYTAGGKLWEKQHFDEGSCYTMVVMLSQPGEDFQGGRFMTWESDGSWREQPLRRGDCLVSVQ